MLQLEEKYLKDLRIIIRQHVDTSQWQPVIFGSRATGRAHKFSDIDLGFLGKKRLPRSARVDLWEALDDSDIPYTVDIVELNRTDSDFQKVAKQTMVKI